MKQRLKYCYWGEHHRRVYIICLLTVLFCSNVLVGSIYTYGNIQPYLVSYIRERSQPSTLRYTQSTYLYSTQYAGHAIGSALGGLIQSKFGARISYISGAALTVVGGLLLSYFTIQVSFWLLFLTYGVMYSVGVGIIYFVTIKCATQWFPKRAGLAVGFVIGGAGLGGLVFAAIQTGFINQDNEFPDKAPYIEHPDEKYFTQTSVIKQVPFIFLIFGGIFGCLFAVGSIFVANPMPSTDSSTQQDPPTVKMATADQGRTLNLKLKIRKSLKALSTLQCYILWIISVQNIMGIGVISSLYKTYGLEVLKSSDYFLTALGGVSYGVCSICGRVSFGFLADKFGYKLAYAIQSGIFAILLSTLYITSLGYPAMYFIWVCSMFFCYGGHCTCTIISILRALGAKYFNINYALIATTSQVTAGFLFGIVSDFCVDNLDWSGTFLLLGFVTASIQLSFVVFFSENEPNEKYYTRNFLHTVLTPSYTT